jgi:hypothetical protein
MAIVASVMHGQPPGRSSLLPAQACALGPRRSVAARRRWLLNRCWCRASARHGYGARISAWNRGALGWWQDRSTARVLMR